MIEKVRLFIIFEVSFWKYSQNYSAFIIDFFFLTDRILWLSNSYPVIKCIATIHCNELAKFTAGSNFCAKWYWGWMNIRVIYSHLLRIVADEQVCEPDRILTFRFRFHLISIHSGIILARTIIRIILSQKCLSFARCSVISSIGNEIISVMECIIDVHFTGVTIDSRKIEDRFFLDYLKSGRRRRICI